MSTIFCYSCVSVMLITGSQRHDPYYIRSTRIVASTTANVGASPRVPRQNTFLCSLVDGMHEDSCCEILSEPPHRFCSTPHHADGVDRPLPAMSGALPWMGSTMLAGFLSGLMFPEGAISMLPGKVATRSERMFPCRFVITMKSTDRTWLIIHTVIAFTSSLLVCTSGYSGARAAKTASQSTRLYRCALLLVIITSFFWFQTRCVSNAKRVVRSMARRVKMATSVATASAVFPCVIPPWPAYSASLVPLNYRAVDIFPEGYQLKTV